MKEIVINACYGGFSLSPKAEMLLANLQGKEIYFYEQTKHEFNGGVDEYIRVDNPDSSHTLYFTLTKNLGNIVQKLPEGHDVWFDSTNVPRDDKNLLKIVKKLGKEANGYCASLKIVKIPDSTKWVIEEYDGNEWIAEKHNTWR